MLKAVQALSCYLVVKDFNLHHTLWRRQAVSKNYASTALVINSLYTRQLELLLELRTITKEKHKNKPFTLDLALCTPNLTL